MIKEGKIVAIDEFTVLLVTIELDPVVGKVGDEVEISGSGFRGSKDIIVEFDGGDVDIESDDTETDSAGEFFCTILIPPSTAGDQTISVQDGTSGAYREGEADFTVEPEITMSLESGSIGDEVAVSGTGFGRRKDVTIYFDNAEVIVTSGTAKTDSDGSFAELIFSVPGVGAGTYDVEAEDTSDNSATAQFTLQRNAAITPGAGNVGTAITASGTGFPAAGTVSIKYDGTQVTTATAKADGTFSATFIAPASIHGDHTITVGDTYGTEQFIFTMESTLPPTPTPLLPLMGSKAEAQTHFDWSDVTDPSDVTYTFQIASDADFTFVVLKKTGRTKSEYTLTEAEELVSTKKEAPYYWRVKAVDGASNESGWTGTGEFYVGSSFALPQWAIYVLFGVGALLFGILGFWLGRRSAYYSY